MSTIRKSKHFIIHMHPNGTIIRSFAQISIIPDHQTPQRTGQKDSERQKDTDKYKKNGDQNDTDRRYGSSGFILPSHPQKSFQKP